MFCSLTKCFVSIFMVWMLFMCLRLLQMFQKLLAKVLISETTFVCFFFLHCSPEYIFTKSPAFFLLFLKQQQCLEFKKKQIMFYLGAHSMSFKQTIRIVWTNCLFSDRYFSRFLGWGGGWVQCKHAELWWGGQFGGWSLQDIENHWAVTSTGWEISATAWSFGERSI